MLTQLKLIRTVEAALVANAAAAAPVTIASFSHIVRYYSVIQA